MDPRNRPPARPRPGTRRRERGASAALKRFGVRMVDRPTGPATKTSTSRWLENSTSSPRCYAVDRECRLLLALEKGTASLRTLARQRLRGRAPTRRVGLRARGKYSPAGSRCSKAPCDLPALDPLRNGGSRACRIAPRAGKRARSWLSCRRARSAAGARLANPARGRTPKPRASWRESSATPGRWSG